MELLPGNQPRNHPKSPVISLGVRFFGELMEPE